MRAGPKADRERHPEAICWRCGGTNVVWSTPNDLWNQAMGGETGIVCPSCFVTAHEEATGQMYVWRLAPQEFKCRCHIDGSDDDGSECICGEINARHCPVHNELPVGTIHALMEYKNEHPGEWPVIPNHHCAECPSEGGPA